MQLCNGARFASAKRRLRAFSRLSERARALQPVPHALRRTNFDELLEGAHASETRPAADLHSRLDVDAADWSRPQSLLVEQYGGLVDPSALVDSGD